MHTITLMCVYIKCNKVHSVLFFFLCNEIGNTIIHDMFCNMNFVEMDCQALHTQLCTCSKRNYVLCPTLSTSRAHKASQNNPIYEKVLALYMYDAYKHGFVFPSSILTTIAVLPKQQKKIRFNEI